MNSAPTRKKPRSEQQEDRRALGADKLGMAQALRRLLNAMRRPLRLERRGRRLRVVLADRRRAVSAAAQTPSATELAVVVQHELLARSPDPARGPLRHLLLVTREMLRRGWKGVEILPAALLADALQQAEQLAGPEPEPAMSMVIGQLRDFQAKAEIREQRKAELLAQERSETMEVSEATHEEFHATERSWFDTLAAEPGNADDAEKPKS
ncbi:MAG: hypothetical protein KGM91_12025 [Burkholderiales bacterium]|nr:hypothetical protein [Burkholderiales bacterium]